MLNKYFHCGPNKKIDRCFWCFYFFFKLICFTFVFILFALLRFYFIVVQTNVVIYLILWSGLEVWFNVCILLWMKIVLTEFVYPLNKVLEGVGAKCILFFCFERLTSSLPSSPLLFRFHKFGKRLSTSTSCCTASTLSALVLVLTACHTSVTASADVWKFFLIVSVFVLG